MSGEGVGKVKPKRTHQAKKPYDRSTSLLGKIKDSVKDLLIPSWLVRSSDNIGESAAASPIIPSQLPKSGYGYNGPQSQSLSFKQSTQSSADHVPQFNEMHGQQPRSYQASSSAQGRTSLTGMDDVGPAPNVNIATLEQQNVSWHAKEKESPFSKLTHAFQQETKKKPVEPALLRMSDSYLEEPADGSLSSSPAQIMVTTNTIKKQSFKPAPHTPQLWSPDGTKLRRALVPPVKDKPAFNALLLSSTSMTRGDGFGESSFYRGKTCYGGSAARRKKALNTSLPYQSSLPLRKQVTANKLNSSLNATTSSTAQRILETLDKMSTPLGDAKKIPQEESTNDSIISFTPSSYRRTSSFGSLRSSTRPLQLPGRGPPISQHQALSQVELARNRNKVVSDRRRTDEDGDTELIVSQEPSAVREVLKPVPPRELHSSQAFPSSSSGKLKSKKFSQHMTNRKDDSEEVSFVPNLRTDFTLPITNINPISLSSRPDVVTSSASSIPGRESAAAPLQFTFSTPIEERRPSGSNQSLNNSDQGFKFSSPIKASQSKVSAAGAEEGSKPSPEPAVGASSVLPVAILSTSVPAWGSTAPKPKFASPDIGGTSSSFKSYTKWGGFNNDSSAASPSGFSLAPAASLKTGSVMDILGGKSSSPVAASPQPDDLMAKFKKPAGTWECDICMLSNKPEAVKCIACEALKPGSKSLAPAAAGASKTLPLQGTDDLMAKFKKPAGTWECDTCMLSNKPEAVKCIACEAPKPGASSGTSDFSNNSLADMFKKPPGNWECDTCLVQNLPTASRCIACDSPKPGLETAGIVSKKPENSTSAVVLVPGGGFQINLPKTDGAATSSSGFKFGNSKTSSGPSTSLPMPTGFIFSHSGISSTTSASTTTSGSLPGGFKFGSTTAISQGQVHASSPSSGFSFGSQNSGTSTTASSNTGAPFNFGNAQSAASTVSQSDTVSSVVEITPAGKLNSNSNGVSFNTDNNKTSTSDFRFGGMPSAPAFSLTNSTPSSLQNAPQTNFNFTTTINSSPSSVAVPQLPITAPGANTSTDAKSTSGLFQFGVAPASSLVSNSSGLGMGPSPASGKALVNGGFGAPGSIGHTTAAKSPNDTFQASGVATFSGLGQNTFASVVEQPGSSQLGQASKRAIGSEEMGSISAKKSFNFGSTNKESTLNGGFHFGGAAQSGTPAFGGSAAAASAPAQPGGFVFGSASKPTASQPSGTAAGGGFQFASGSSANAAFTFGQAAAASKPFEPPGPTSSFKAGGLTANFNFGGVSQPSNAPFQFGAKLAESAASAPAPNLTFAAPQVPQLNGPSFGGGMGTVPSFNVGVGETGRRVKKAARRINKNK